MISGRFYLAVPRLSMLKGHLHKEENRDSHTDVKGTHANVTELAPSEGAAAPARCTGDGGVTRSKGVGTRAPGWELASWEQEMAPTGQTLPAGCSPPLAPRQQDTGGGQETGTLLVLRPEAQAGSTSAPPRPEGGSFLPLPGSRAASQPSLRSASTFPRPSPLSQGSSLLPFSYKYISN